MEVPLLEEPNVRELPFDCAYVPYVRHPESVA